MKWRIFELYAFSMILAPVNAPAQLSGDPAETTEHSTQWHLTPNYVKLQYAGGMGLISAGVGWEYGRRKQWESDVYLGFVPKFSTDETKMTGTLKQNFIPWNIRLKNQSVIAPLTCGAYLTAINGENFWTKAPSKYPDDYYGFMSQIRVHAFVGQRVAYKKTAVFYEFSSCDIYILSALGNRRLHLNDIVKLSLGLKMQL
jgi:hypothetical protein